MVAGKARSVLDEVLDRLLRYTQVHFGYEERLMRESRFPFYPEHKAEHEALTRRVLQFREDFIAGRATLTISLLDFLKRGSRRTSPSRTGSSRPISKPRWPDSQPNHALVSKGGAVLDEREVDFENLNLSFSGPQNQCIRMQPPHPVLFVLISSSTQAVSI